MAQTKKFRTKWDETEKIYTNPGSPDKVVYGATLDPKTKNLIVEPKAKESLYDYINSFADSVNLNVLISRFVNGDKEVLLKRAANYIDITGVPDNLNDYVNYMVNADALFDTLPVEVKEQFNNNRLLFSSQIGTEDWKQKMNTSEDLIKKNASKESRERSQVLKDKVAHAPTIIPSVFDKEGTEQKPTEDIT